MAGEIQVDWDTGFTLYALIRNSTGAIWNGSAFETYSTANYANYDVALAEQGTASAFYVGTFPSAIAAGTYSVVVKRQAGGSVAETDSSVGQGDFEWSGSAQQPRSDCATSGQVGRHMPTRIYRQQMLTKFPFKMINSSDNKSSYTSGATNVSGGISGQVSKDGGAFAALASGNFSEVGKGWYTCVLTSGETDADTVILSLSAPNANQRDVAILTQPVSGVL